MAQKPRKGDFVGVKIQNITRGSIPPDLPRIGIRSVFILDPRLNFHIVFECNGLIAMAWFYSRRSVIVQYIEDHIASGGVQ